MSDSCKIFAKAKFMHSAAKSHQWPEANAHEIAFVGASNVGKSSSINTLTSQKKLARVSKTPGRTQLINFFEMDEIRRIVDLPGYGFAKVPLHVKKEWAKHIEEYLFKRECLEGLVLLVDSRHDLKPTDIKMIEYCEDSQLPILILMTKSDKISKNQAMKAKFAVESYIKKTHPKLLLKSIILFSALTKQNLDQLQRQLLDWLDLSE